jgi:molecular chaperone DnaK (HSP70)
MAKTRQPYAPEFRRQLVKLVHAGRSPEELAREFEPTAQSNSATRLRVRCEQAKISLSAQQQATVLVPEYLPGSNGRDLFARVARDELLEATGDLIGQGMATIDRLLSSAGCHPREIEMVLPTGGMLGMPAIHDALTARFESRVQNVGTISRGDRIIAEGNRGRNRTAPCALPGRPGHNPCSVRRFGPVHSGRAR